MVCPVCPIPRYISIHRLSAAFCLGAAVFGAARPSLRADDTVTLRVWADPEYAAQKAARSSTQPETYVVVQGEYFDGACRDTSVDKNSLAAILQFLAPTLTKQNYYPAKSLKTADEVLVVHWGTTIGYMSDYVQTPRANATTFHQYMPSAEPDVTQDDQYHANQVAEAGLRLGQAMNTATAEGLLGYSKQLNDERSRLLPSEIGRSLESSLKEDRYFVILQAYDYPRLAAGKSKKLLWSVHMSMRSPGTNFTSAVPAMGEVASDLYGTNADTIAMVKAVPHQHSSVEIGPIAVLGESKPVTVAK